MTSPGTLAGGVVLALLLVSLPPTVLAQSPPDAGRLLEDTSKDRGLAPPRRDVLPGLQEPARPALRAPEGIKVKVSGFRITGLTAVAEDEVKATLAPFTGKELGLAELQAAADAVTQLYRSRGYFLARAYVPQQAIRDGIVEIAVLEGRLGRLSVKPSGEVRLREGLAERTISASQPEGSLVHETGLERSLLLLNDLPGITAQSVLSPGAKVGTTDLAVQVSEGPLFTGGVDADNFGNRFTGEARLGAQLNLMDPSGYGDLGTLRLQTSRGLDYARGAYTLPVGADGFRLTGSASALRYELCCDFAALKAKGTARELGLTGSYPLIRSRARNVSVSGGYTGKALFNETIAGTTSDKTLRDFNIGVVADQRDAFGGGGFSSGFLGIVAGKADLGRYAPDLALDAASAQTQGSFTKLNYSLARIQRLTRSLNLLASLSGQRASKNLDSAEKFSLGGPYGVRGYPTGEAVGDEGELLTAELRWEVASRWQLSAFADHGRVRLHRNEWAGWQGGNPLIQNNYELSSVGLGATYTRPGDFSVRLMWAHALGSNPGRNPVTGNDSDNRPQRDRAWIQAVKQF